jgi:hypothetical protein
MRKMSPLLKVIVVFMLVVNAAFFFWHFNRYQSQPTTHNPHREAEPLELISKTTVVVNENDEAAEKPGGPVADLVLSEDAVPAKPDKPYDKDSRVKAWQPTAIDDKGADATPIIEEQARPPQTAEPAATSSQESQTSIAPTKLTQTDSSLAGAESEPAAEPTLDRATATQCTRFGPVLDREQADKLLAAMQKQDIPVRLEQGEAEVVGGYWIMLPPFSSTAAAKKGVQILKGQGVKDVAVIGGSDYRNAISLGVFSLQSSRDRRLRELTKLGYKPIVKERIVTKDAFWLNVSGPATMSWADLPAAVRRSVDGVLAAHKCAAAAN